MKRVTVTELKNKLSQYLRLVKRGEAVEILERSIPIARLQAIEPTDAGDDGFLDGLIRDGIVTPSKRKPSKAWLKQEPLPCRGDAVRAVIDGRGER